MAESPAASSEEEVRRLLTVYQQYQAEAEAIVRQLGLFQLSVEGCEKALKVVEEMEKAEEGQEMLVPIGQDSFIHAKLATIDKVIVGVGAGVSIEKSNAEAKESLSKRKAQLSEASAKLNQTLSKIEQEMGKIQSIASRYEQQYSE
ncbi:MAG: prefoldin subunit alpha [Methanothrix sp.]|uniref:Prefoldin subunit alpha n=1 Tax=Methanothrix harundinacea TaxID=301375 RepID=A0A101ILW5_9EURY|nr:MAG: prefoldin subunit alpha [Methanosaeta sp. SDB]KUK45243.1 MAG: Prefoldin subunit alpha [Methanothrix harundinacea]MDD2638066.1 prefoldin subunit alpha [Methanothrix sp.]MDI9399745.1 prefoldin subunit alpha [Euryarchaeota archaeon]KUK97628.1 MAG: Prefoldin subunit alpha [Methanothrix harundinacea]